jgi:Lysyl oxidase
MASTTSPTRAVLLLCAVAIASALALAALVAVTSKPAGAATDQLPDLGMDRITNIQIQNTNGKRLLRFTTRIVNVGAGNFELHGSRDSTSDPTMTVTQRIFDDAGSHRDRDTTAQMYFAGDGHDHWHTKNLARYRLIKPNTGTTVGTGAKEGFCFYDNYRFGSTQDRYYTSCGHTPSALRERMGISRGWGDTYSWKTVGQHINVSGLADGRYRLWATADQDDWFLEVNEDNNSTWTDIRIRGSRVSVIGYGPSAKPI